MPSGWLARPSICYHQHTRGAQLDQERGDGDVEVHSPLTTVVLLANMQFSLSFSAWLDRWKWASHAHFT